MKNLLVTLVGIFFSIHAFAIAADPSSRPNILIIFTDDQGYADLGCFGSKTNKTPRFDQLAKEGTMFTDFYAQTVCGPSRSALLTGRYPHRSGGWGMPASEITWAEMMKDAGYETICIGKWDVSDRSAIIDRMPNAQGFQYYFGPLGANDQGKVSFHENNEPAGKTKDMASLTRLYTDKAIHYLKEKRDKEKPFVLYLSHTMAHTDINASERFLGKSKGGLYGDVVEELDYETGRLLDTLDELDLAKNTLVIYTTDNGPWNQPRYIKGEKGHPAGAIFWGDRGPLRDGKGSCYEAGTRVPCIIRWPGKVAAGAKSSAIFSTLDLLPTFANLSGFKVPNDRVIDGVDQTDLLLGKNPTGNRDNFFHTAHLSRKDNTYTINGMRKGQWKFLKAKITIADFAVDPNRKEVPELYDLETDIGETKNLADKHPEIIEQMNKEVDAFWNDGK